jgi:hypothetical protein
VEDVVGNFIDSDISITPHRELALFSLLLPKNGVNPESSMIVVDHGDFCSLISGKWELGTPHPLLSFQCGQSL